MRAVDTNVLVRLLARDDLKQVARGEEFIAAGAWVSHIVLVECMWVLESVYERTPKQIATAVEMLLSHESLAVQDLEVVARALESFRARPKVGFSDCLIVEVARKAGHTPLGTFDRDLAKIEGTERL